MNYNIDINSLLLFVGGLIGAVTSAAIFDRASPELAMGTACGVLTVGLMTAPFTGSLIGFILLVSVMGLGAGFIDGSKYV